MVLVVRKHIGAIIGLLGCIPYLIYMQWYGSYYKTTTANVIQLLSATASTDFFMTTAGNGDTSSGGSNSGIESTSQQPQQHLFITSATKSNTDNGDDTSTTITTRSRNRVLPMDADADADADDDDDDDDDVEESEEQQQQIQVQTPTNRSILFIHVGKAGGETIKEAFEFCCNTRVERKKKICLQNLPESQLSKLVNGYQHGLGPINPRNYDTIATTFLINIRHPLDRIISWYGYVNPFHCNLIQVIRHTKNGTKRIVKTKYGPGGTTNCIVRKTFDQHTEQVQEWIKTMTLLEIQNSTSSSATTTKEEEEEDDNDNNHNVMRSQILSQIKKRRFLLQSSSSSSSSSKSGGDYLIEDKDNMDHEDDMDHEQDVDDNGENVDEGQVEEVKGNDNRIDPDINAEDADPEVDVLNNNDATNTDDDNEQNDDHPRKRNASSITIMKATTTTTITTTSAATDTTDTTNKDKMDNGEDRMIVMKQQKPFDPFCFLKEFFACYPTVEQFAMGTNLKMSYGRISTPNITTTTTGTSSSTTSITIPPIIRTPMTCAAMARIVAEGGYYGVTPNSYPFYSHARANYKFYYTKFFKQNPNTDGRTTQRNNNYDKEIFVVRTDNLWDDLKGIEKIVGGINTDFGVIDGSHYSHGSERYKYQKPQNPEQTTITDDGNNEVDNSTTTTTTTTPPPPPPPQSLPKPTNAITLSIVGTKSLCCALLHEIILYKDILFRSSNLDKATKRKQWQKDIEKCYFTSFHEMLIHCSQMTRLTDSIPII